VVRTMAECRAITGVAGTAEAELGRQAESPTRE
jgi:hypothetical protein